MNFKLSLCSLALIWVLLNNSTSTLATPSGVKEKQLEEALLQQLHSVIVASLKSIYKTEYATFSCEQISSINELVTHKNKDEGSISTDAIHGAKYFEITISLCDVGVKKDHVVLYIKNDSPTVEYYLDNYKINPID